MKHKTIEIFLFIDALGWTIVKDHDFLTDFLPYRKKTDMQFGYSCSAIPSILSGKTPSEHGHLGLFRFAPEVSPFKNLSRLAWLFKPASFWKGEDSGANRNNPRWPCSAGVLPERIVGMALLEYPYCMVIFWRYGSSAGRKL